MLRVTNKQHGIFLCVIGKQKKEKRTVHICAVATAANGNAEADALEEVLAFGPADAAKIARRATDVGRLVPVAF